MSFDEYEGSRHSGEPIRLYLFKGSLGDIGPFAFCDGVEPFTRDGITYQPWPIKIGDINQNGTLDKADLDVTLAAGSALDQLFVAYPPSQVINLTIFEGHIEDEPLLENFPAIWIGRTSGASYQDDEVVINCLPVSTSLKRPGLRRNYQIGCPHALYGPRCKANKAAATLAATVASVSGRKITLTAAPANPSHYSGGVVEWTSATTGWKEIRTIVSITGAVLTVRGIPAGAIPGVTLAVSKGCDRMMTGCRMHSNIKNYGGQPWMPRENPLSTKNQFY